MLFKTSINISRFILIYNKIGNNRAIPPYTQSGVLPPFRPGATPTARGMMAPYKVSLVDVAKKFATSEQRIKILKGLIAYRKALRLEGISTGFQWLDGSFVEDSEQNRGRPPSEVDVITFSYRPEKLQSDDEWRAFINSRPHLFNPEESKRQFLCDAYFVDMKAHPINLINQTKYWFGLFSHQRDTLLWKGMLEVSICDDTDIEAFLSQQGSQ
jgi:hypothetical protein